MNFSDQKCHTINTTVVFYPQYKRKIRFMSYWKLLFNLFWLLCFTFSKIAIAAEQIAGSLPINGEDVYSIVVTPNKAHGANSYKLKIYTNEDEKRPTVSIVHPLNGKITDVEIYDIDNDSQEELVIQSTKATSTEKVHHDIFELSGKSLFDKIKDFLHF